MDKIAHPHRACVVREHLWQNVIDSLPQPARNPNLNPIEQLWRILGCKLGTWVPLIKHLQNLHKHSQKNDAIFPRYKLEA